MIKFINIPLLFHRHDTDQIWTASRTLGQSHTTGVHPNKYCRKQCSEQVKRHVDTLAQKEWINFYENWALSDKFLKFGIVLAIGMLISKTTAYRL